MKEIERQVEAIAERIRRWPADGARRLVAIAGPPGAGKSTLAETLVARLGAETPGGAALVPMDGFHLDNVLLDARDLRARKGAPESFDAEGFVRLVRLLGSARDDVVVPTFDRALDLARAGAAIVPGSARLIVLEGNYLLLDEAPWRDLAPLFDLTVRLEVEEAELEGRLVRRWLDHGRDAAAARAQALANDIPNARRVVAHSLPADMVLGNMSRDVASPFV